MVSSSVLESDRILIPFSPSVRKGGQLKLTPGNPPEVDSPDDLRRSSVQNHPKGVILSENHPVG